MVIIKFDWFDEMKYVSYYLKFMILNQVNYVMFQYEQELIYYFNEWLKNSALHYISICILCYNNENCCDTLVTCIESQNHY